MSKFKLFLIIFIVLAAVLAFVLVYKTFFQKAQTPDETFPVIEIPQTNPFEEVKTNPFKDIKTNPFE